MYISTNTRPDISYSVNYLSKFQNCCKETHFKYALRILKYLYRTRDLRLDYKGNEKCETIDCYVDADWAGDHLDRKSTSRYVIRLYGNVIGWKSKKTKVCELMYIREITKIFNVNLDDNPVKIYEDNSRAISIVSRPAYFKSDGPMMEIEMWRPWRQCISPKCLKSHLCPNGPSTECFRSVATVTYVYRIVGILRDDKQRRNRCYRKSHCKSFSLGKSRLELRTKSQSV